MPSAISVLMMGGTITDYHSFEVMGPIYEKFLTAAGFNVSLSENRDDFLPERIRHFDVIVCYTTRGTLTPQQSTGLLEAIAGGKGFVGIHSAAASFMGNDAYLNMVGAKFLTHPPYHPQLSLHIHNYYHPIMEGISEFILEDELYLMETRGDFELLMSTWWQGFERPITWVKPYGMGRVVYTALGHGEKQTENPFFQRLIINAIRWTRPMDNS